MFRFAKEARERILALTDLVTLANSTYHEALTFYGEDAKSITATDEFFGVFKTFVTSYKVSEALFVEQHDRN
jgi:cytokinesis protein